MRPPARPRVRLRRPGVRGLIAIVAVLAILAGAYLWVRQSSLVAVRSVTIVGVSGPDATQIRASLRTAAHGMSTLDVQTGRLHTAVAAYPVVRRVHVSADFPHGLRIDVSEQVPVAVIAAGGRRTVVSGDGTLLRAGTDAAALPTIALPVAPGGTQVTGAARTEVALLAAAPYALLAKVATASESSGHGLTVTLRNGPDVYFGPDGQLAAKWSAATAVLADSSSAGADYIDVTDPARPAAGTGSDAGATAAGTGSATGATSPGATTQAPSPQAGTSGG